MVYPLLTSSSYSLRGGNDEDTHCEDSPGASLSFSSNDNNFYSILHMEDDDSTSITVTTPPSHPSLPTGSFNGCAQQLSCKNGPQQTPQPHDPIDHNTNEYKKKYLRQSTPRMPKDSGTPHKISMEINSLINLRTCQSWNILLITCGRRILEHG